MFHNKVILDLGTPLSSTYQYDAYPLSILAAYGDAYKEWYITNYIQLKINKYITDDNIIFLEFCGPPSLYTPYLYRQLLLWSSFSDSGINIHNYIERNIKKGYYFYFQVDTYFIPHRPAYKRYHNVHDLLIYGYDKDKKIFYIAGYDENYIFTKTICTYSEFDDAFYANNYDKEKNEWADRIRMYRYNKNASYPFNLDIVKLMVSDFIKGENSYTTYNRYGGETEEKAFGIDVYSPLQQHISLEKDNLMAGKNGKNMVLDIRAFRLLMEHKNGIGMLLQYMDEHITNVKDLIELYDQVSKKARCNHSLALKYVMKKDTIILDKISNYLNEIKECEKDVFEQLLKRI